MSLINIECDEVRWVKGITPEAPIDPEKDVPKWSVIAYPTKDGIEIVRDLQSDGLKNVIKKDQETGKYCVKFSRPTAIWKKNKEGKLDRKVRDLTPPVIKNADGTDLNGDSIGNGSAATVQLDVYSHGTPTGGKAKAARWESMTVTRLIPFTRN